MSFGDTVVRVFVVDDDSAITDTLCAILRSAGFSAWAFYDGQAALEAALIDPPDFVISDVSMPKLNGLALATELRKRYPEINILLFSGNANLDSLISRCQAVEGCEILNKPVHPSVLIQRVSAAQATMAGSA